MARGKLKFKQIDLTRALRSVRDAGVDGRVEIDQDGKIVVVVLRSPPLAPDAIEEEITL